MSSIKLGNISIVESLLEAHPFIIGDVVDGGGYEDPFLVNDEEELRRKFRFAKNYEAYRGLIQRGATLALAGNRKSFDDFPTLVIFNQNSRGKSDEDLRKYVESATPKYIDLDKETSVIHQELLSESIVNHSIHPFKDYTGVYTEGGSEVMKGYRSTNDYTYRIKIIPKGKLATLVRNDNYHLLILPLVKEEGSSISYNCFGVSLGNKSTHHDPKNNEDLKNFIDIDLKISSGVNFIPVTAANTKNKTILDKIVTEVTTGEDFKNYYDKGEVLKVEGTEEDPYLVLETPYPIKFFDFCKTISNYNPITGSSEESCFDYVNDVEYTQKVYYLRGLLNQGAVLKCRSRAANKEGREIKVDLNVDNGLANLYISQFEEEYEYHSSNLFEEVIQNPLIELIDFNYSTTDQDGTEVPSVITDKIQAFTNSFDPSDHDFESLYKSYESFFEYDIPISVIVGPRHPNLDNWRKYGIISILKKFVVDHLQGGLNSTLVFQLDKEEEGFVTTLPSILGVQCFWFSGKIDYEAVYQYLYKWLDTKNFTPDPGVDCIEGSENTLTFKYNGFEIEYDEDDNFMQSLAISHTINSIYSAVYPGIRYEDAMTNISNSVTKCLNFHPILDSVVVNSIKQIQNTLEVDLDIIYKSIPGLITINFKIYKTYGRVIEA